MLNAVFTMATKPFIKSNQIIFICKHFFALILCIVCTVIFSPYATRIQTAKKKKHTNFYSFYIKHSEIRTTQINKVNQKFIQQYTKLNIRNTVSTTHRQSSKFFIFHLFAIESLYRCVGYVFQWWKKSHKWEWTKKKKKTTKSTVGTSTTRQQSNMKINAKKKKNVQQKKCQRHQQYRMKTPK